MPRLDLLLIDPPRVYWGFGGGLGFFSPPVGLATLAGFLEGNGVLVDVVDESDGRSTFHWRTEVPTNTYGVALNVAPYVLIEDTYTSSNGTEFPVQFWAIEDHAEQARDLGKPFLLRLVGKGVVLHVGLALAGKSGFQVTLCHLVHLFSSSFW